MTRLSEIAGCFIAQPLEQTFLLAIFLTPDQPHASLVMRAFLPACILFLGCCVASFLLFGSQRTIVVAACSLPLIAIVQMVQARESTEPEAAPVADFAYARTGPRSQMETGNRRHCYDAGPAGSL